MILWQPQEKQRQFMERPEYEALYGGAAGGGKSDALLVEALRQVSIPHYSGIILRKTYPMMVDLIERSRELYKRAYPKAKYNTTEHIWRFPSGARIAFGSMQREADRVNYQGRHYDYIAFDELTHFTFAEYSYLMSRNRPSGPGTRVYMRATANPGGVGHGWVKERFITAAPPMTPIKGEYEIIAPDGKPIKMMRDRIFIPSTVFDNQELLRNNPGYLASLAMLPEAEKQALLYGSWDSFSGQVFLEWCNAPAHYQDQRWTHVIEPFRIPAAWRIVRGLDWGYARPFSVGWYAVDHDGRLYRIREFYGCTGTPNEGAKMTPQEVAKRIRQIEAEDDNLKGRTITGIADPAIFQEAGGESIGDMMAHAGVYWETGDHKRIPGKMQLHYRLAFDEEGVPMLYVFNTCRHFIRTIPALVYDEKDVEDVDTSQEDHIYDECRYVCMEHPLNPRQNMATQKQLTGDDPLNQREPKREDKYTFYRL